MAAEGEKKPWKEALKWATIGLVAIAVMAMFL